MKHDRSFALERFGHWHSAVAMRILGGAIERM